MQSPDIAPMTRREWIAGIAAAALAAPPDFERIDTHTHIHRAAPNLLAAKKKAGWRALSICDVRAVTDEPSGLEEMTRGTIDACLQSKGRLTWAATFDPRGFESRDFAARTLANLDQCFDQHAVGVKMWKNVGMGIRSKSGEYVMPDNPAFTPIFEGIQRAGKTLLTHLADLDVAWKLLDPGNPDSAYYKNHPEWLMHGRAEAPAKEAILAARDRILSRHPKLRVIGCHFGSSEEDLGQVAKRLDAFPNYAVDVASRVRFLVREDNRMVREFMLKYADRVLYATDFRLDSDETKAAESFVASHALEWSYFSSVGVLDYRGRRAQGLALPQNVLRRIFRDNALHWLAGI